MANSDQKPALTDIPLLDRRREMFAREYVAMGCYNASEAYRRARPECLSWPRSTISSEASVMLREPAVADRIRQLRAIQDQALKPNWDSVLADWVAMANADPNEIVRTVAYACRHCYGKGFRYQWRDHVEFAMAVASTIDLDGKLPDDDGGYGYTKAVDPNLDCPECHGAGIPTTLITDTTKLSRGARKLIKSIKQKADGSIEIELHDQNKTREYLGRALRRFGNAQDDDGEGREFVLRNALTPGVK